MSDQCSIGPAALHGLFQSPTLPLMFLPAPLCWIQRLCNCAGITPLENESCQGHGCVFSIASSRQWLHHGSINARALAEKQQWAKGEGEGHSCPFHSSQQLGQIKYASKQETLIHLKVSEKPNHSFLYNYFNRSLFFSQVKCLQQSNADSEKGK